MKEINALLASLRRPRLLIRAARFGIAEYDRKRDLKRLIAAATPPAPVVALDRLITEEARMEGSRKNGDASYSVARHVDVLIALMAEARLLPQPSQAA